MRLCEGERCLSCVCSWICIPGSFMHVQCMPILKHLLDLLLWWCEPCVSLVCQATARLRSSLSCFHTKARTPLWQGEPASKGTAAPAKKAEPAARKAPEADHQPPAPAPAPGKSKHGRKPQRDQQSANQALQLFSHLQQYRVGVPCSAVRTSVTSSPTAVCHAYMLSARQSAWFAVKIWRG